MIPFLFKNESKKLQNLQNSSRQSTSKNKSIKFILQSQILQNILFPWKIIFEADKYDFILLIQSMSESSDILYQDSSYCLSCWGGSKQKVPKATLSHFISNDCNRDSYDKKVSLKKYNINRLKQSDYKLSIDQDTVNCHYSKTARVFQSDSIEQKYGWSPVKITFAHHQRPISYDQRYSYPFGNAMDNPEPIYQVDEKPIKFVLNQPQSRVLSKTTKIQRIMPTKSEELKKTKKNVPFHKIVNLASLKESVCSYTQSYNQQERLEESQILMDYFHPTEDRLNDIETYMKQKKVNKTQSIHIMKQASK